MHTRFFLLMVVALLIYGCSNAGDNRPKYEGRSETKKLQGADAAGYDGTAIRKNVDNTLNKNDQHNESVNKALKGEEGQK